MRRVPSAAAGVVVAARVLRRARVRRSRAWPLSIAAGRGAGADWRAAAPVQHRAAGTRRPRPRGMWKVLDGAALHQPGRHGRGSPGQPVRRRRGELSRRQAGAGRHVHGHPRHARHRARAVRAAVGHRPRRDRQPVRRRRRQRSHRKTLVDAACRSAPGARLAARPASSTDRAASRSIAKATSTSPTPATIASRSCRHSASSWRCGVAPGQGPGEFRQPFGVSVDADGAIYVADHWNNRIQKLSPTGAPRGAVGHVRLWAGPIQQSRAPWWSTATATSTCPTASTTASRSSLPTGVPLAEWGGRGGDARPVPPARRPDRRRHGRHGRRRRRQRPPSALRSNAQLA